MAEMYGVDFGDNDNEFEIKSRKLLGERVTPSIIMFLKRTGLVKNDSQALFVMLVIIGASLFGAYYFARPPADDVVITPNGEISKEAFIQAYNNGVDLTQE